MNIIEESQLLRQNRMELVEAINSLGFTTVDENTPMSELAECVKWAGGLRDIRVATYTKATGEYHAYTREQWSAMSSASKAGIVPIGLEIRAEGWNFIIAKEDAKTSDGNDMMMWSADADDIPGLPNITGANAPDDVDGEANTDAIIAYAEQRGSTSFYAAQAARSYKASTLAIGGFNDPTKWSGWSSQEALLVAKYSHEINKELNYYFGAAAEFEVTAYWILSEVSATLVWMVYVFMGYLSAGYYKSSNRFRVRPIAKVPKNAPE